MRTVDKMPQAVAIVSADSQYLNGVFIFFLNGVFNKFLLVIMSTNHLLKIIITIIFDSSISSI